MGLKGVGVTRVTEVGEKGDRNGIDMSRGDKGDRSRREG